MTYKATKMSLEFIDNPDGSVNVQIVPDPYTDDVDVLESAMGQPCVSAVAAVMEFIADKQDEYLKNEVQYHGETLH